MGVLTLPIDIPSARFDSEGKVLEVNDLWLDYCGFSRAEVLGSTMKIVQGEETEPEVLQTLMQACQERKPVCVVLTNYTKDKVKIRNKVDLRMDGDDGFVTYNEIVPILAKDKCVLWLASDGSVRGVSDLWLSFWGYSRDQVASEGIKCLQGADTDQGTLQEALSHCKKTKQSITLNIVLHAKSQTQFISTVNIVAIGKELVVTCTIDINKQTDLPCVELSLEGLIVDANEAWLTCSEFSRVEAMGKRLDILYGVSNTSKVKKLMPNGFQGSDLHATSPHFDVTRDGRKIRIETENFEQGNGTMLQVHRFTFLLPDDVPCMLLEKSGRIANVNEIWLQACGFSREEVVGQTLELIQGLETEPRVAEELLHSIKMRRQVTVKLTCYTKLKRRFYNTLFLTPAGLDQLILRSTFDFQLRRDVASALFDSSGVILRVNNLWLLHCGFSREEVVGKTAKLLQGPHTEQAKVGYLLDACKSRKEVEVTITNYTKDKLKVANEIRLLPVGCSQFITENNFRHILRDDEPSCLFDSLGRVLDVNEPWLSFCGFSRDQVVGRTMRIIQGPSTEQDKINQLVQSCRNRKKSTITVTNYSREKHAFENTIELYPVGKNQFLTLNKMHYVLRQDVPSALFDKVGRVLSVNRLWLDFCGYTKSEVMGKTLKMLQGPETELDKLALLEDACRSMVPISLTITNYTKDRTKVENHIELFPVGRDHFISVNRITVCLVPSSSAARLDEFGKILDVTDAWLRCYGFSKDEVIGQKLDLLSGPKTEQDKLMGLLRALKRRTPLESRITGYTRSKQQMSSSISVKLSGESEFVVFFSCKCQLVENVPCLLCDGDGKILDVNLLWLKYTGFQMSQVVGNTMSMLYGPETEKDKILQLQQACRKRQSLSLTITCYTKNEVKVINHMQIKPMALNKVLVASSFQFGIVLAEDVPTLLVDSTGKVLDVNKVWLKYCGYQRGTVIGSPVSILQGPETDKATFQMLRKGLTKRERVNGTVVCYTQCGEKFSNCIEGHPIGRCEFMLTQKMTFLLRSDIASALFDQYGRVLNVNDVWLKYCEFTKREVVGNTLKILQGADTETIKVNELMAACRARQCIKVTITNYTKSGIKMRNRVFVKPVGVNQFISVHSFDFVLRDDIASLLLGAGDKIVDVNDVWLKECGYKRNEVLGKTMELLFGVETDKVAVEQITQACRDRRKLTQSLVSYSKGGRKLMNHVQLVPVGVKHMIVCSAFDLLGLRKHGRDHPFKKTVLNRNNKSSPEESIQDYLLKGSALEKKVVPKDVVSTASSRVDIRFVYEEFWHASYVRTRHKNLRCFPFCAPSHKERSFCGLPITVMYPCETKALAQKVNVLGSFRKVREPLLLNPGDRPSKVLKKEHDNEVVTGLFTSFDEKAKFASFELRPPRKWRYKCEQSKYTTSELHTFTVYLVEMSQSSNEYVCVGSADSPAFNIVSAWNQSLKTVSRPLEKALKLKVVTETRHMEPSKDPPVVSTSSFAVGMDSGSNMNPVGVDGHQSYSPNHPFPNNFPHMYIPPLPRGPPMQYPYYPPPPYGHPQYNPYAHPSYMPPPYPYHGMLHDEGKGKRKRRRDKTRIEPVDERYPSVHPHLYMPNGRPRFPPLHYHEQSPYYSVSPNGPRETNEHM